jgi:hypothetical protein
MLHPFTQHVLQHSSTGRWHTIVNVRKMLGSDFGDPFQMPVSVLVAFAVTSWLSRIVVLWEHFSIAERRSQAAKDKKSTSSSISVIGVQWESFAHTHTPFIPTTTHKNMELESFKQNKKQTPWPLVRKRTIPSERLPLVDEIWCQLLWIEGCHVVSAADLLRSLISVF